MASPTLGKNFSIFAGGANLACAIDSISINHETEEVESTKLCTDGSRSFLPGLMKHMLSWAGCYDVDATDADALADIFTAAFDAQSDLEFSVVPGVPAIGDLAFIGVANQTSFSVDAETGALINANGELTAKDSPLYHGKVLYFDSVDTDTDDGASLDNGALSSNGGFFIGHVYLEDDSDATDAAFTLQHSVNDSTWVDLVAQTAVGDVNGAISAVVAPGTTVNRYLRVQFAADGVAYGFAAFKRL